MAKLIQVRLGKMGPDLPNLCRRPPPPSLPCPGRESHSPALHIREWHCLVSVNTGHPGTEGDRSPCPAACGDPEDVTPHRTRSGRSRSPLGPARDRSTLSTHTQWTYGFLFLGGAGGGIPWSTTLWGPRPGTARTGPGGPDQHLEEGVATRGCPETRYVTGDPGAPYPRETKALPGHQVTETVGSPLKTAL